MAKFYSDDLDTSKDTFWTTDMGLVGALTLQYPIKDVDTTDPGKVAMGFDKTPELDEYLKKFWNKDLRVEPQAYYNEIIMLRKRINQELKH